MEEKRVAGFLGISKEEEEKFFLRAVSLNESKMNFYHDQIMRLEKEFEEVDSDYAPDDIHKLPLLKNIRERIVEMEKLYKKELKSKEKPYFGRVDITDQRTSDDETYYIGKRVILDENGDILVMDWRSPLSSVYYENHLGLLSYTVELEDKDDEIFVDLKRKRNYDISDGVLRTFYDTEVIANDDLLTKYLAKTKKNVLNDIIATIQDEQNMIIRKTPFKNVIVQGAAGSGKTTVAMHRISHILYNYKDKFRPEDFYVVGSNQILLNYITGVLPELDADGVLQMTMEELFTRLLYEDYDPRLMEIIPVKEDLDVSIKGRSFWFYDLQTYLSNYEVNEIRPRNIYLCPGGPLLLSKEDMIYFMNQVKDSSMESKKLFLNEILVSRLENEFQGKYYSYSPEEKKSYLRKMKVYFGDGELKESIFDIYERFVEAEREKKVSVSFIKGKYDLYDLASLAFIYKRLKETEVIKEASHIVIDEAQDFGMCVYRSLKYCLTGSTYSIMGDVSQNIHYNVGLNDWEELIELMTEKKSGSFSVLKKSYRNTIEIANEAKKALSHGTFTHYEIEPIIRNGNPVSYIFCETEKEVLKKVISKALSYQEEGYETIAIIAKDEEECDYLKKKLSLSLDLNEMDENSSDFSSGISILPVSLVKGLEFDAVILYDPSDEKYPLTDDSIKILYVALTRALHELSIIYKSDLTTILSKPYDIENEKKYLHKVKTEKEKVFVKPKLRETFTVPTDNIIHTDALKKEPERKPVRVERKFVKEEKKNVIKEDVKKPSQIVIKETVKNESPYAYGTLIDSSRMRPKGHSEIISRILFMKKTEDGIEAYSNYGILKISVISDVVFRIRFVRTGNEFMKKSAFSVSETSKDFKIRETREIIEVSTSKMSVVIDKAKGNLSFLSSDKRILLSEKGVSPRQKEKNEWWTYFDFGKKEKVFSKGILDTSFDEVTGKARYISFGNKNLRMPLVYSEKGYGIAVNSALSSSVCMIPMYGPYIYAEHDEIDYYFIIGPEKESVLEGYKYILGKL